MDTRRMTMVSGLLLSALVLLPALAAAQDARGPRGGQGPGMQGPRIGWLLNQKEALGLSAEQVNRLEAIGAELRQRNEPHRATLEAARADGRIDGWARGRDGRPGAEGRQEFRRRIQEEGRELSPDERQAMRERMRERRESMTPEQREEMRRRMQELSPEERAAMRERRQGPRPRMTQEQRAEMRQRMHERRAAIEADPELASAWRGMRENGRWAMDEVRRVLTAEQQAKARDLMRARAGSLRNPWRQGARQRR